MNVSNLTEEIKEAIAFERKEVGAPAEHLIDILQRAEAYIRVLEIECKAALDVADEIEAERNAAIVRIKELEAKL